MDEANYQQIREASDHRWLIAFGLCVLGFGLYYLLRQWYPHTVAQKVALVLWIPAIVFAVLALAP